MISTTSRIKGLKGFLALECMFRETTSPGLLMRFDSKHKFAKEKPAAVDKIIPGEGFVQSVSVFLWVRIRYAFANLGVCLDILTCKSSVMATFL